MPASKDMPSTLRRSSRKARETWAKAHDAAAKRYGDGESAHRTAFAALKHSFEKVGDRWKAKPGGRKGPSDRQAAKRGAPARRGGATAGGIDANASVTHLRELARKLDVPGRSRMSKGELVASLKQASRRATAKARSRS